MGRARTEPLLSTGVHARRRPSRSRQTLLCWVLVILAAALVGLWSMTHFEARLHTVLHGRKDGSAAADAGAADAAGGEGQAAPEVGSGACVAALESRGLLPDAQGVRLSAEERRRRAAERKPSRWHRKAAERAAREAAEDQAAAVGQAALTAMLTRRRLYADMEAAFRAKGLALAGSSTQGMGLGDMFRVEAGELKPVVTVLDYPVRAIVMPLTDEPAALKLEAALRRHVADPLMPPASIWLQHHKLYHSTIFHASTHMEPHYAKPRDVDMEEYQIRDVGHVACPLHLALERVVATPGGTILACWQIVNGTDVLDIRNQLEKALPKASKRQVVTDRAILHTTLARLVAPPRVDTEQGGAVGGGGEREAAAVLQGAVDRMTAELCGLRTIIDRMWFVEEYEKLALALRGSFKQREVPLECEPLY